MTEVVGMVVLHFFLNVEEHIRIFSYVYACTISIVVSRNEISKTNHIAGAGIEHISRTRNKRCTIFLRETLDAVSRDLLVHKYAPKHE